MSEIEVLRTIAVALNRAAEREELPDRVYMSVRATAQMIAQALAKQVSELDELVQPEATTEDPIHEFTGSQFRAADIFSQPESLAPRAWAESWHEAASREYGSIPSTALELAAHILEGYRAAILADAQRSIAACVSALGIQVTESSRDKLPEFIQLRDHIAGLIRDAQL